MEQEVDDKASRVCLVYHAMLGSLTLFVIFAVEIETAGFVRVGPRKSDAGGLARVWASVGTRRR